MNRRVKRYAILILGWVFIFLGILGLFLPILQGILFLTIGLILLSRESVWAAAKLDWLKTKYPRFGAIYEEAERRATRLWHKLNRRKQ
jgi:uncharacterized membrane protein YbaN (DUF454 family)